MVSNTSWPTSMTNCTDLLRTVPVLTLEVPHLRKPISSGQIRMALHPNCNVLVLILCIGPA